MNDVLERRLRDAWRSNDSDRAAEEAARGVKTRAEEEGLLDVAYARADSPLGPLILAATPRGLARVAYVLDDGEEPVLEDLARRISPRVLEHPARLDVARRELAEYFDGRRRTFEVGLDLSLVRGFVARVLEATARIPYGEASSYTEVAGAAGSPRAVRAAGNALGSNPIPVVVPCHRVLRSDGSLGGYTGGLDRKKRLLELERG